MTAHFPTELLSTWFKRHRRNLPWRHTRDPYKVWVSEVMLQQTQVAVVIPYYERWMQQFPTIEALATASLEEVIKAWEGLGYYSRARNLHEGAKQVVSEYGGQLPVDALCSIKGIGEYTKGAIRAFAFRKKAAAVDGNVLRVIARYDGIDQCIAASKTKKIITQRVEELLPEKEPWIVTEALIELGATHCSKKANCCECPLRSSCTAYATDRTGVLPVKTKKTQIKQLYRTVAVVTDGKRYLVYRGEQGKVMADLYQFPYWETDSIGWSKKKVLATVEEMWGTTLKIEPLCSVQHGFTRFRAQLTPWLVTVASEITEGFSFEEMQALPFTSGDRKILQQLHNR